jgi:hypothetical protein
MIVVVMVTVVAMAMMTKSVLVVALVADAVAIWAGAVVREAHNSLEFQDSVTLAPGQGREF